MDDVSVFLSQHDSKHTVSTYQRGIKMFGDFIGGKPWGEATDEDVAGWRKFLAAYNASTQFTRWTAVRSFYRWLLLSGRISRSPFETMKSPKKLKNRSPKMPTNEQLEKVIAAMSSEDVRDVRDSAIILCLATGLRISEVAGLSKDDFFYIEHYKVDALKIVGKGFKERVIPLPKRTTEAIKNWIKIRPVDAAHLFYDPLDYSPMTPRRVQSAMDRAKKRAGVDGFSSHSLRHHYATRLIRSGASVFSVQKLLGHESVATTQIYVNLDITDTIEASRMDPIENLT